MEIRLYDDADESTVLDLWRAALADNAPHNDPVVSLRQKLAVGRDLFYVAVVDAVVVGTVLGGYDGHRGWIYSVAVDAAHRRRGIGSALLRHLEAELRRRGCLKANLQVRTRNLDVVAFYESLGFTADAVISMGKRLYSGDELRLDADR
jgi:hypothetical protein